MIDMDRLRPKRLKILLWADFPCIAPYGALPNKDWRPKCHLNAELFAASTRHTSLKRPLDGSA